MITRRSFLRNLGIAVASLLSVRCTARQRAADPTPTMMVTRYEAMEPEHTPTPTVQFAPRATALDDVVQGCDIDPGVAQQVLAATCRDCLRACWWALEQLAEQPQESKEQSQRALDMRDALIAEHRAALDALVTAGALTSSVADHVHEAYAAATGHIFRANSLRTCYEPEYGTFRRASSEQLTQQAAILAEMEEGSDLDPRVVLRIRTAIERDVAYLTLSEAEVQTLQEEILKRAEAGTKTSLDDIELEIAENEIAATDFLIELLLDGGE
jgi:hypothetical protein